MTGNLANSMTEALRECDGTGIGAFTQPVFFRPVKGELRRPNQLLSA